VIFVVFTKNHKNRFYILLSHFAFYQMKMQQSTTAQQADAV